MALTLSLNGIKKYLTIWPSKASLSLSVKNTDTYRHLWGEVLSSNFQVKFFSHKRGRHPVSHDGNIRAEREGGGGTTLSYCKCDNREPTCTPAVMTRPSPEMCWLGPSDDSGYRDVLAWPEWRQYVTLQRRACLARVPTMTIQRCAGLAWVATATTEMCWLSPGDVGGTVAGSPATLLLIPL